MSSTSLKQDERGARATLRAIGWAAFLGASWTWCIGMFLPVLLVRDYGLWAWVVFAVPNVVGAAAMAWVLRDGDASLRVLHPNLPAAVGFSFVTIAFHVFFLVCIVMPIAQSWFVLPVALLGGLLSWLVSRQVRGGWPAAAAGVLVISLIAFVMLGLNGALALPATQGQLPTLPLLWLLPVSIFGFALCPYLDLTFHRARQATSPASGRLAFGVGFGVFFLLMIVMTLLYAPLVMGRFGMTSPLPANLVVWLVAIHMAVQSWFTIAAHLRYAGRQLSSVGAELTTVILTIAIALLLGSIILVAREATYRGLGGAELSYRAFMAFYGLVFPAYVWLCMIPARGSETVPRRALMTFGMAVLVAAPMFWMGFIERRTIWLVPGVAVVLLAQLAIRFTGQGVDQASPPNAPPPPPKSPPRAEAPEAAKNFLTAIK
ncbi:MAG: hypothetical protein WBD40_08155 [Tepidisphaeraceae bacterium]